MAATPHDDGVNNVISHAFAGEASALAWLVGAGADVLVDDAPRNWLKAPPPAAAPAPAQVARPVSPAASAPSASAPSALARAAETLNALVAALAGFDHPLRRAEAPRLFSGAISSGIIIIAEQPETPGGDVERLRARMLAAIGLDDSSCGILNLLPWPTRAIGAARDAQIADLAPFVARALGLAAPRLLLALGESAAALGGPVRGIASARGHWRDVGGVPLLTTFHPRNLMTQPAQKSLAWADLQAFAERLPGKP